MSHSDNLLRVGDAILIKLDNVEKIGLVQYIASSFIGVELVEAHEEGHVGTHVMFNNIRLFQAKSGHGMLVRISNIIQKLTSAQLVMKMQQIISLCAKRFAEYIEAVNGRNALIESMKGEIKRLRYLINKGAHANKAHTVPSKHVIIEKHNEFTKWHGGSSGTSEDDSDSSDLDCDDKECNLRIKHIQKSSNRNQYTLRQPNLMYSAQTCSSDDEDNDEHKWVSHGVSTSNPLHHSVIPQQQQRSFPPLELKKITCSEPSSPQCHSPKAGFVDWSSAPQVDSNSSRDRQYRFTSPTYDNKMHPIKQPMMRSQSAMMDEQQHYEPYVASIRRFTPPVPEVRKKKVGKQNMDMAMDGFTMIEDLNDDSICNQLSY